MEARMPSVNSTQAISWASVGQRPSQVKEYSKANSVSLTMSWPHKLALSRWLARFHKWSPAQAEQHHERRNQSLNGKAAGHPGPPKNSRQPPSSACAAPQIPVPTAPPANPARMPVNIRTPTSQGLSRQAHQAPETSFAAIRFSFTKWLVPGAFVTRVTPLDKFIPKATRNIFRFKTPQSAGPFGVESRHKIAERHTPFTEIIISECPQ
ncbi:hypothetical protein BH10PSE16_BH10PSE16_20020 [soil metagenome]